MDYIYGAPFWSLTTSGHISLSLYGREQLKILNVPFCRSHTIFERLVGE